MILTSKTLSRSELAAGLSLIRAFFPQEKVNIPDAENLEMGSDEYENHERAVMDERDAASKTVIQVEVAYPDPPFMVCVDFENEEDTESSFIPQYVVLQSTEIVRILSYPRVGKETQRIILLKHGLFHLLTRVTGHRPPWGILTGIRPSKILHRFNDQGILETVAQKALNEYYLVREDKAQLLQAIVKKQRPYLQDIIQHPEQVAVYIGIPFCPTRCSYCSFPAYSLKQGREPLQEYLQGLFAEIQAVGAWMKETQQWASSLYLGGGTPTILTTEEMTALLHWIRRQIPLSAKVEFTVEAGRPDTLSQEKLQALHEQGVNRLSINPQTMHNRTLQRIGRAHSVEDVVRVYTLARQMSDWVINMDLILGLPGESAADVDESLNRMGELHPDNLTVHALALKRGSQAYKAGFVPKLGHEFETMQELVLAKTRSLGMQPYYLYRQKQMAGNLENIGFALPHAECRYNIGMMEERQSVIGIGAGASSKAVNPVDFSLTNLPHPSHWQTYIKRWPELFAKRAEEFERMQIRS